MHLSIVIVVVALFYSTLATPTESEAFSAIQQCVLDFEYKWEEQLFDKDTTCSQVLERLLKQPVTNECKDWEYARNQLLQKMIEDALTNNDLADKCPGVENILEQMKTEHADLDTYPVDLMGKLQDYIHRG